MYQREIEMSYAHTHHLYELWLQYYWWLLMHHPKYPKGLNSYL